MPETLGFDPIAKEGVDRLRALAEEVVFPAGHVFSSDTKAERYRLVRDVTRKSGIHRDWLEPMDGAPRIAAGQVPQWIVEAVRWRLAGYPITPEHCLDAKDA